MVLYELLEGDSEAALDQSSAFVPAVKALKNIKNLTHSYVTPSFNLSADLNVEFPSSLISNSFVFFSQ